MADNGNNTILFSGSLQQLSVTLTNAYSGYTISIDEEKNVNNSVYDGMGGFDIMLMSNYGDALFIDDGAGNQTFKNIEIIIAGDGGDLIDLSSTVHLLTNGVIISGGEGDDILWGNVGSDTINGAEGDDILDGGPGHDNLFGEADNDYLSGGDGNDNLDGGAGNDILVGGAGSDTYIFTEAITGGDTIIETASAEINSIKFNNAVTQGTITYEFSGNDLILNMGAAGTITIQGQFNGDGTGIDTLIFADNSTFDLRTITPPNEDPVANDDAYTGDEDTDITGNVLDNDTDANNDTLSVVAGTFTTVNGGTVELLASGDFTYTPAANYFGADSFSYTVNDGQGGSDTASVELTINSVNDAPIAQDDSFSGDEDTDITGNVLGNDSDVDAGVLAVVAGTFATLNGGSVTIDANGDFAYTPAANYFGADSFSYTVNDGQGGSDTASVELTINSINDAPTAQDDVFSGNEDTDITGNVLSNDNDSDGGTLAVIAATITTINGGTVELLASGDFTYTPAANYFGADSFSYTVNDGQGGSDTANVNLTINSVNDAPTAHDDAFSGDEDTDITGNVLSNDSDVDGGVLAVVAGTFTTANGSVTLSANGDFIYTPNADYFGADSFSYTLNDGQGGSATATVNLTINDVPEVAIGQEIYGTAGANLLQGGAGDDTLYYNADASWTSKFAAHNVGSINDAGTNQKIKLSGYNRSFDQFEGGAGIDTIMMTSGNDAIFIDDMFSLRPAGTDGSRVGDIEIIRAGDGNDIVDLTSNQYDYISVTIYGDDGNDYLWASSGDDVIYGGTGNDDIYGGLGNDTLYGEDGNDTIRGAGGQDVIDGGDGNDTLYGGDDNDIIYGGAGNDKIYGDDGDDTLYGGDGNDTINGGVGNDTIYGDDGNDTIHGNAGNDKIFGGEGNDKLYGDDGDDILVAGLGNDTLYGGAGHDVFAFESTQGKDTIKDFDINEDAINITDILSGYTSGDVLANFVKFVTKGAHTEMQINHDGVGNDFVAVAQISGVHFAQSVDDLMASGTLIVDQSIL